MWSPPVTAYPRCVWPAATSRCTCIRAMSRSRGPVIHRPISSEPVQETTPRTPLRRMRSASSSARSHASTAAGVTEDQTWAAGRRVHAWITMDSPASENSAESRSTITPMSSVRDPAGGRYSSTEVERPRPSARASAEGA